MDEGDVHSIQGATDEEILTASTAFDNSERRSTYVLRKADKENVVGCDSKKGARKKWDRNPNFSVVFPPWSESDCQDFSSTDNVLPTSAKSSATFIIYDASVTQEDVKLRNKILCDSTTSNQGLLTVTNHVNSTKQSKDIRRSLQVVSKSKVESKRKIQQRRSTVTTKSTSVAGLPQRKLALKKPAKTSVQQRADPLPYACRNTLYDEHWSSKQERAFTKWLNYMLAPLDCYGNTIPTVGKKVDNTGQLLFKDEALVNNNKFTMSPLHSYRKEARLQRSACVLYQSSSLEEVFLKLEVEVETRRLSMRLDQTVYSDIGLRQQLIELLDSYNAPWLKLGVEVLFGEKLPMHTAGGEMVDFATYCVKKLCENDNISRAYMCKIGTHGAGYEEALLQFAYRKLLMMVIFLDRAKMERLMDNDPCLFVKTANVKSSKQLLLALSGMFLCGEGDVVKHLRLLGYTLHHIQRPLDEYDFTVTNLATDLRDGIRLCRLTEMLTSNWELSGQLRVPAAGKTQKLHNVDVVLKALRQYVNFPQLVTAQVIVQGHRELTLSLLWSIIFHFKVELQLDLEELRKEIEQLKGQKQHPIACTNFCQRRASLEASIFFKSPSISLLLQWCQAVCAIYGVMVTNFTTSFCDGRVLCYIIHHYHPSLLPLEAINNHTSLSVTPPSPSPEQHNSGTNDVDFAHNWTKNFSPTTGKDTAVIANERANFKLLSEKMLLLGGVPPIVMSKDMVDTTPDEKVVITYTSYLCKQLLSISSEVRASMVIQRAWRRFHAKMELSKKLMKRDAAAVLIQAHVRGHLAHVNYQRKRRAVIVIQQHWRAYYKMLQLKGRYLLIRKSVLVIQCHFRLYKARRRHKAARTLQAYIRGHLHFRRYQRLKHAACVIQLAYRRHLAVKRAEETRKQCAALKLQSHWRKCIHQRNYLRLRSACITIQRCYRATVLADEARSAFKAKRLAAITIQSAFRGFRTHIMYSAQKRAAITIQQWFRSILLGRKVKAEYTRTVQCISLIQHCVKKWFHRRVEAAVKLQATIRGSLQRHRYVKMQRAVVTIQQHYRAHRLAIQSRQYYCLLKKSCIVLQAAVRGWRGRQMYKRTQSAAVRIQSWYRGHVTRQHYIRMRNACNVIARHWRAVRLGHAQCLAFLDLRSKTVRLQAVVRGWQCRKWVGLCHASAAVIQKTYRAHLSRRHTAATKLQAVFRAHHARQLFLTLRQATTTIQVCYRAVKEGRRLQEQYQLMRTSAITIQSAYRGHAAHKNYIQLKMATLAIQTNWRRHKQQMGYNITRGAILYIQQWYRWAHLGRLLRQRYLKLQWAAITIQRSFVMYKQRKEQRAAVKVQSVIRCVLARKKYLQMVGAATTIQAFTRGYLVRCHIRTLTAAVRKVGMYYKAKLECRKAQQEYQDVRSACITIQAAFRGWKTREYVVRLHLAVQTIEGAWLARQQRVRYLHLKQSAIIIQRWFRSILCTRQIHMEYVQLKSAAVVIQSFTQGLIARRLYRSHLAARRIQSCYRGYRARCHFLRIRSACVTIQSWIRRYFDRKNYLSLREASLTIQSRIRALNCGRATRSQYQQLTHVTIFIQATYKAIKQRRKFVDLKRKATNIQSWYRMCVARKHYQEVRRAAVTLQTHLRSYFLTKRISNDYRILRGAAITIQCHLRAHLQRSEYLRLRQAAVTIQAAVCMYQCRKVYQEKMAAVLILQRHTRALLQGRKMRCSYVAMREAAIVIQSAYRQYRAVRHYHAAVTIQSHYRRHIAQVKYNVLRGAAINIQRYWRGWQCYKHYHRVRQATLIIQSRVRALYCGRAARNRYQQLIDAAIFVQATYKAIKQRRTYLELRQAAVTIQAAVRMYQCRKVYQEKMAAVLILQRHTRALLQGRKMRCSYVAMREAAIVIQSAYRQYRAVRHYHAAVTIQSHYRRHIAQVKYNVLRGAAINIQRYWRGWQCYKHYHRVQQTTLIIQSRVRALYCGRAARNRYQQLIDAAIFVQATYKAIKQRRTYLELRQAAVTIQAAVRMYQCRKVYQEKMAAVLVLQRHTRALLQGRKMRCSYVAMREAAIVIQSAYRQYRALKRYNAVVTIQSHYRRHIAQVKYNTLRGAAINIQRLWRGRQCYNHYQRLRQSVLIIQSRVRALYCGRATRSQYQQLTHATIFIQATYKAMKQRRMFLYLRKKAIDIQSWYRMCVARKHYQEVRRAAVTLQTHLRSYLLTKRISNDYRMLRGAAITTQCHLRAHLQRSEYLRLRQAAVTIQAAVRMYQCRKVYQEKMVAVIVLQKYARALLEGRKMRCSYVAMREAAIVIQSAYRQYRAVRHYHAVVTIQSHYRRHIAQVKYNVLRGAAINIQRYWRGWQCYKHYHRVRQATLIIQSRVRALYCGRAARNRYQQLIDAAIFVQATYKAIKQRRTYLELRQAAVTLQAAVCMYQCRKVYQEKMAAVLVLQRHTRALLQGRKMRCSYVAMREAAIVIQSAYRQYRAVRQLHAAIVIQSHYRRHIAQVRYNTLRGAAINIQRYWRGRQCRVHYNRMSNAALCLQKSYRGYMVRAKMQLEFERRVRAAIIIQAAYRGHLCYTKFTRVRWVAVTLQSHFRRLRAMNKFNHIKTSVIFIQQKWRATLLARSVQAGFEAKKGAALVIQRYFRGCQCMKKTRYQYVCLYSATVILQRAFRRYLTYRRQQKQAAATCIQRAYRHFKKTVELKKRAEVVKQFSHLAMFHLSAILIQRSWRCYQHRLLQQHQHLSTVKLQAWFKMIVVRQRYRKLLSSVNVVQQLCRKRVECIHHSKLDHCATLIQAHWRGYWVRCQVSSQIEEMRRRIKRASSEERQQVTLRDQMPSLLHLLLKGKYLSHGAYVLEKLELITRLSDSCSLVLVQAGGLPALCDVINGTNRNRASLLLVETALQILLNLTRWPCTCTAVLQHHGFVSTIVQLMHKIYISQPDIMQQCCQLLTVYCRCQEAELVQNRLGPEVKRLCNMAASLKDKLLILGRKWQRRTMTPLIEQQHQQLQRSLSSLEKMLNSSVIHKC